jgi:WhiB family transcriptional regulator, redox-sensing transcriptional regulator
MPSQGEQYLSNSTLRSMWLTLELSPQQRAMVEDMNHNWGKDAACKGSALFTQSTWGLPAKERKDIEDQCRAICDRCPVLEQCYDHAMSYPETGAWWGGLSADQRRAIRKKGWKDDRDRRFNGGGELCGVRSGLPVGS